MGIQPGESGSKVIDKHPTDLAKFAATYFFANDSIAISAKYLPKKAVSAAAGSRPNAQYGNLNGTTFTPWTATSQTEIEAAFDKATANINKSIAISEAIEDLAGVVNRWHPSRGSAGRAVP